MGTQNRMESWLQIRGEIMHKRVIRNLLVGALCVILTSFIVLTPVFFVSFRANAINELTDDMHDSINHIKPLAQMSLSFRTSKMDRLFNESMSQFSYFSKSNILFMDTYGNVIWANNISSVDTMKKYSKKALEAMGSNPNADLNGVFDEVYGEKTITIGEFLKNDAGENMWAVFCSKPRPTLIGQYKYVIYEILLVEIITLIFAAVFMFLFSRSITKPLKNINNTLKEFAKGNFDKRVEYSENNEIGELALNINQMADSISSLEKMRQDFVSDISHERRTPMTSISGFVEGILDGTIPKENQNKYLAIVLSETKRLSRLVNELLTLSRIDDQVKNLSLTNFDMEELTKLVLIKFEGDITSKGIDVDFETYGDEFIVNADKDKYTQVLTNLIHNAVKFTDEEGKITICLKTDNQKCICSVKNTGYGIDEEKLRFIWERFYKVDNSRSTDRSGTGIGLYIVKKIIDAHSEKISVKSVMNEYTEFVFTVSLE